MTKHLDPRVIKTRSSLKTALISLMQQYKIENISVQKITETAHITRGTFYLHYKDKRDFISRAMTEILDDFFDAVIIDGTTMLPAEYSFLDGKDVDILSLNTAFSYIESEAQMFSVLLNTQENGLFEHQLNERLTHLLEEFHNLLNPVFMDISVPVNIQIAFVVSAYVGLIKNWLSEGMIYTPHYMTSSVKKMIALVQTDGQDRVTFTNFFHTEPEFAGQPQTTSWQTARRL
ncbi:TetR/AcrR family transcriptional regulator [Furfurilactobacillus siliginis]|uniref:TetR family transcriptional regulator n=1 Tax=Furfurilactobacillus siliginis TaxID=348151 RepID=A0A0R2L0T9_9LACO|nr:TetR/AcrR family transcriptional regulator [Furfurilactobacillus siliginis]KRN95056.1 TetR family transcriptional regulator [Furfurilactobacillus siliginis]GEK28310.1 TetR family transcriptional regulator [Furfurilactobacillus siliginis]